MGHQGGIFKDSANYVLMGGIPVSDEGTRESYEKAGATAVRRLRCRWSDRRALITWLRSPSILGSGSIGIIGFGQPYPDDPSMFVQSIVVSGEGSLELGNNGMLGYAYAVLDVTYVSGFSPYETGTLSVSFESAVLSTPQSTSWLYFPDGKPVPYANSPKAVIPVLVVNRTLTRIAKFPQDRFVNALRAPVNSTSFNINSRSFAAPFLSPEQTASFLQPFYGLGGGGQVGNLTGLNAAGAFDAGTVRFSGGDINKTFIVGGYTYWNANYQFKIRLFRDADGTTYDWNSVIDIDGKVKRVFRQDGSPMMPASDLNLLFNYD